MNGFREECRKYEREAVIKQLKENYYWERKTKGLGISGVNWGGWAKKKKDLLCI